MSEPSAFGPDQVILSVTVEINGRRLYAQSGASLRHWRQNPKYQEDMKAHLLQTLGEVVVKELAPEIMVTMPGPTLHEALTEALRPFDYPSEY